jgi:hypothetical protein
MLSVRLEAQFSEDGSFDFGATIDGIAGDLLDADFGDVEFDASTILDLLAGLAPPEIGSILESGTGTLDIAIDLGDLDSVEELLVPLRELATSISTAGDIDLEALGGGIDGSIGIDAIALRIDDISASLQDGPVAGLFDVLGALVPGLSLSGTIGRLTGPVGGLVGLITLIGGLMATESLTAKLERQTKSIGGMLDISLARDAAHRLTALASTPSIPSDLTTIDPLDSIAIGAVIAPIEDFLRTVQEVRDVWSKGLAFGEGALLGLDVAGCSAGLVVARAALDESTLGAVADLAATVRALVDPVLELELPDPGGSLDEIVGEGLEMLVELRETIDGFDAAGVVGIVTESLDAIIGPISDMAAALEGVATSLSSAIRTVRELVNDIDLTPIEIAIDAAVQPVIVVLDGIEAGIDAAQQPIVAVAEKVGEVLAEIRASIEAAADVIDAALGRLSAALDTVDIASVQDAIESGLGSVAATLNSAQLAPYFDAAIDAIGTTSDIVDAVPFGMLPTDVQQEVVDAVKPVKEIRFDIVADALQAELGGIVDALNTDVLDAVDAAYMAVLEFLESVDPKTAITTFEDGPFAEFEATVAAIDPSALLEPVDAALADVQGLLSGIDIQRDVLAPVQTVFDDLTTRFDDLDPSLLLEPLRQEIDDVRQGIADSLHLDDWVPSITFVRDMVVATLDRIDPAAITDVFDRSIIDNLLAELPSASGPIAAIVSGLAQAGGLSADADAWTNVRSWFGDVDGRLSIEGRLSASAALLSETRDGVRELDPEPLIAVAQLQYRAIETAAATLAPDTVLASAVATLLEGPPPSALLGPIVENRKRYLAKIEVDATALAQVSVNGHSEITAITDGLVDALQPITSIGAWFRGVLARFGITDLDQPFVGVIETLLDIAGPDRLLPPLVDVIVAVRTKVVELVDAALAPALDMASTIESTVNLIDIGPLIDEVKALHTDIGNQIDAVSPDGLLGDVIARFDGVVDRLETFDPLAPVRLVIDELTLTVDTTFDTLRPTVIFKEVCDIYATIVELAGGLDVRSLLEPILAALADIVLQLDAGLEGTAEALGRLQDALPGEVSSSSLSGSASVGVGVSL